MFRSNPEVCDHATPNAQVERGSVASTRRRSRAAVVLAPVAFTAVTALSLPSCSGSDKAQPNGSANTTQPPRTEAPTTAPKKPMLRAPALWFTDSSNSFAATPELRDKICSQPGNPVPPDDGSKSTGAILTTRQEDIQPFIGDRDDISPNIAYVWPKESPYISDNKTGTGYAILTDARMPSDGKGTWRVGITGGGDEGCWGYVTMNNSAPEPTIIDVIPTHVEPTTIAAMNAALLPIA